MFPLDCEGIGEHCSESCHTEFGRIRAVGFIDPCYDLDINSQESWDEGVAGGFITIVPQTNGELTIDQLQGDGYGKRPQTNTIKEYTLTYNDPTFIGNYNFYDGASGQYKYKIFFRTSDAIYFSDTAVLITPNFSIQNDLGQRIDWTVTLTWRSKFFPIINTALNSEYLFACTACTPQICFFIQSVTGNLVDNTDPCNPVVDAAVSSDPGNVLTLGTDGLPYSSGGASTPNLQQVTDVGNSTTNDIIFGPGVGLLFDNGARVREGTTDAGLGGLGGVALRCSIDYELKWDAGSLYVMEQNGFTIRKVVYKFSFTPAATDDSTKGFVVGSLWILDDETTYECTDNTSGAAVWVLRVPGTVTSVSATVPNPTNPAFSVNVPNPTTTPSIDISANGLVSQYVRGDGSLANFPASSGGGASVNYYLNGSVNQGTFGGNTYYEMSRVPIIGGGTNIQRTNAQGNGYIAQFITDAGDPNLLSIPGGNWNFETYFSASSSGGTPSFYLELYKYDGTTFTLIASNSTNPEGITGGTVTDLYVSALAVPTTTLLATDRLAVRIYVVTSGRTITLHTENNSLCQVITTFTTGLTALNGLTDQVQNFATGTSGTDFGISSSGSTHTFNLPTASAVNRGALSSSDWSTFNSKVGTTRTISTSSPLSGGGDLSANRTISIADAAADGTTKGVATFTANDFNSASGVISLDYTNGQKASSSQPGFLSSTDWSTFNGKQNALGFTAVPNTRTISTSSPLSGGGDLSANRTLSIADAVADGTTKGAATFTANDFNSASGVISLDYTNGQKATALLTGFLSAADWSTFNGKQDNIIKLIKAGSDQTTTSTSSQAVTELETTSLEANKSYILFASIRMGCNNTGGVNFGINVPTGATGAISTVAPTTGTSVLQFVGTAGNVLSATSIIRTNTTYTLYFYGRVLMGSTTGTVQFTFASAVSGQTSTIYGTNQSMMTLIKMD